MPNPPITNYRFVLENTLRSVSDSGKTPSLLLHACCAPCSSYVLEYLSSYFNITLRNASGRAWVDHIRIYEIGTKETK